MKRSAAIIGDTPPFAVWSIRRPCLLKKDIDPRKPQQVESTLRALRVTSKALDEGRIVEQDIVYDFCGAENGEQDIFVCSVREIAAAFGGWPTVESNCNSCVANVTHLNGGSIVGCFGWVTIDDCRFLKKLEHEADGEPIRKVFRQASLPLTNPLWYGLFSDETWNSNRIDSILRLFELADYRSGDSTQLDHFYQALHSCKCQGIKLDLQSYPPGHSNGLHWELASHCPACRGPQSENSKECEICGHKGAPHPLIRRKVRGYRPLVRLTERFEKQKAIELNQLVDQNEKDRAINRS